MHVEMWTNLPHVEPQAIRRVTRAEFDQLVELGAFAHERLELIRGVIVRMPPQGPDHANPIVYLNQLLVLRLAGRALIRIQLPLVAPDESEPEPHVAVVALGGPASVHPSRALLVIEVSRSRLEYDRRTKGPLYAEMGVPEFWIVDVEARAVEVRRAPEGEAWTSVERYVVGQSIDLAAFPDVKIAVADVFG